MINAVGYAAKHSLNRLKRFEFQREDATDEEVDVEVIPIDQVNDAYDKVEKGEVRFRYVIEMATLKQGLDS